MSTVESLSLVRFKRRMKEVAEEIGKAKAIMETLKEAAAKNVENQKILNAHLVARNQAYRDLNKPKVQLEIVQ